MEENNAYQEAAKGCAFGSVIIVLIILFMVWFFSLIL